MSAPVIPGFAFVEHLGSGGFADVFLYEQQWPRQRVAVKVVRPDVPAHRPREVPLHRRGQRHGPAGRPPLHRLGDHGWGDGRGRGPVPGDALLPAAGPRRAGARQPDGAGRRGLHRHQAGQRDRDRPPLRHPAPRHQAQQRPGHDLPRAAPLPTSASPATWPTSRATTTSASPTPGRRPSCSTAGPTARSPPTSTPSGATIWHLLVGRSPFSIPSGDNSTRALSARILHAAPPATQRPDVPPALDRLLQQCLAKRPEHRPASALELARALQRIESAAGWPRTPVAVEGDRPDASVGRPAPVARALVPRPGRGRDRDEARHGDLGQRPAADRRPGPHRPCRTARRSGPGVPGLVWAGVGVAVLALLVGFLVLRGDGREEDPGVVVPTESRPRATWSPTSSPSRVAHRQPYPSRRPVRVAPPVPVEPATRSAGTAATPTSTAHVPQAAARAHRRAGVPR